MHRLPDSGLSPEHSSPSPLPTPTHSHPYFTWSPSSGATMLVPEVSLTLRALFSGTPSPSLLLQGEWRPLSHPPILPCPQSTPWRIFQQPPSFFPMWWPFMTSPSGREGETRKRIYVPVGEAEGGRLGSQGPSPQLGPHAH